VDVARLRSLLDELAEFGRRHDADATEHSRRMLNVTPETGRFLAVLVRAIRAAQILEVGTSNGYSTIWLAWAAGDTGGHVTTIERSPDKVAMARANLGRAGLADRVTVQEGVAHDVLRELVGPYDLVFLDADRRNYPAYLGRLIALLRPGGLLVTDNVVSHPHEVREFLQALENDPHLDTVIVPVGNGEALTYKMP
jgi:predicted O-methyltransferase YrrM